MKKESVFKYKNKDKLTFSTKQKIIIFILILISLLFIFKFLVIGIILSVISLIYIGISYPQRTIKVDSRYLICGKTIVYYKNINRIVLNKHLGVLLLYSGDNLIFKLEKELFPTNARKPDKIINNKNKKFEKVSDKIINKIIKTSPDVKFES